MPANNPETVPYRRKPNTDPKTNQELAALIAKRTAGLRQKLDDQDYIYDTAVQLVADAPEVYAGATEAGEEILGSGDEDLFEQLYDSDEPPFSGEDPSSASLELQAYMVEAAKTTVRSALEEDIDVETTETVNGYLKPWHEEASARARENKRRALGGPAVSAGLPTLGKRR